MIQIAPKGEFGPVRRTEIITDTESFIMMLGTGPSTFHFVVRPDSGQM